MDRQLYYRRRLQVVMTGILLNWSIFLAIISSRILGRQEVHVIGDSHTWVFRHHRPFRVYHVGPSTAYMLAREHSTFHSRERLLRVVRWAVRQGDHAILVFGEIDCRIHIYNSYVRNQKKRPITEFIDNTIKNYALIFDALKREGVDFFVLSVPPAGEGASIFGYQSPAPTQTRSAINSEFNNLLGECCAKRGFKFIDVYSRVVDKNGFIAEGYTNDELHLNDKVVEFVLECLREEIQ